MDTVDLTAVDSDPRIKRLFGDVAAAIARAKRVVAITGAGISVSSGIPDFRSSDGLYNLVKAKYPDAVVKGQDLFSASLFRTAHTAAVFYSFAASLKRAADDARPSRTHTFMATLARKNKLLRSYTQNIDGLETRAGLGDAPQVGRRKPQPHNVQLHGDIHRVRCTICSCDMPCSALHLDAFDSGTPPPCPECTQRCMPDLHRHSRFCMR
jgi:NAD+-dependent protein deacetylase SIR2